MSTARAEYDPKDLLRTTYLVAVNQTERALLGFNYITKFLDKEQDRVVLLYCLEKTTATLHDMRAKFEFLSELAMQLRDKGISHRCFVKKGKAKKMIVTFARELNAHFIVIGTRSRSKFKRFVLGSVSAHIIKHAPCSVMAVVGNAVTTTNLEAGTPPTARSFMCYVNGTPLAHTAYTSLVSNIMVEGDKVISFSMLPPNELGSTSASSISAPPSRKGANTEDAECATVGTPLQVRERLIARQLTTYADFAAAYHLRHGSVVIHQTRALGPTLRAAAKRYGVDGLVIGVPMDPDDHEAAVDPISKASLVDIAIGCVQKVACNVVLIVKYQELDTTSKRFDMNPEGPRTLIIRQRLEQLREAAAADSLSPTSVKKHLRKRSTAFAPTVDQVHFEADEPPASASSTQVTVTTAPTTPSTPLAAQASIDFSPQPTVTPAADLEWDIDEEDDTKFVVSSSSEYTGSYYSTASEFELGSSLSLSSSSGGSVDSAFLDFLEDVGGVDHLMGSFKVCSVSSSISYSSEDEAGETVSSSAKR